MVKIIKQKEGSIRDTVGKKSIAIFGLKVKVMPKRLEREREEKEKVVQIVKEEQGEEKDVIGEVKKIT